MSESYPNSGHPLDFVILLVRHWRAIIYTSIAAVLLVYLVLFLLPNTYRATARLLPPQQNLTLSAQLLDTMGGTQLPGKPNTGGWGAMAANFLGLKAPGDLFVSLMTGDTISDRIIKRFGLQKLYRTKYLEDTRLTLHQAAKVTSSREGVISVEVTDKDPKRAADIANAYIDELEKLLQRIAVSETQVRLAFLEKEHAKANQNLTKAEEALRRMVAAQVRAGPVTQLAPDEAGYLIDPSVDAFRLGVCALARLAGCELSADGVFS
jgi:tyrosine-protein kinase Etk/Wzc